MSTYLLAFAISQFTCTEGYSFETNVPHSVCSRPEEAAYRTWAVDVGTSAMRSMESTLGIKFGMFKVKSCSPTFLNTYLQVNTCQKCTNWPFPILHPAPWKTGVW